MIVFVEYAFLLCGYWRNLVVLEQEFEQLGLTSARPHTSRLAFLNGRMSLDTMEEMQCWANR